jgi:hypothetical protein
VATGDEVVTTVATGQIRSTVTGSAAAGVVAGASDSTESPAPDASPESTEPRP